MTGGAGRRRLSRTLVVGAAVLLCACSSSPPPAAPVNRTPLPVNESPAPHYCDFVSRQSVQTATGFKASSVPYEAGSALFNSASPAALVQAFCEIDALGVQPPLEVTVRRWRAAYAHDVVDSVASGNEPYLFPTSYGVGYARTNPGGDVRAEAELLYGDYYLDVRLGRIAAGRNGIRDVVALTREVIADLHPSHERTRPYPEPTS